MAKVAISQRIVERCDELGLSRRGLAWAAGLSPGTLTEICAGRSDPALGTMLALLGPLELNSIEELITPLGTTRLLGQAVSPAASSVA